MTRPLSSASVNMSDSMVSLEIDENGVATVRMQHEPDKNALSVPMVEALQQCFARVRENQAVKAVVITGLPQYFCVGASLDVLTNLAGKKILPEDLVLPRWILDLPVPTIAAAEGHALGGGLALAMCADIILIAEESRYGCTFMNMGFTPGMGTTRLLEHAISPAIAHEMLFTGRAMRGSELRGKCAFNYVLPRTAVLPKALALAVEIAEKPRLSLTLLKETLSRSRKQIYESALEDESRMHRQTFAQPGVREQIEAYLGWKENS